MIELRKQLLTFLRDERGLSGLEYAALGVLIVLGIVVVLSILRSK